jgi:hypothetical protein
MSIFKKECFQEYLYKRKWCKKTFDNHLDRKKWVDEREYDTRYVILNSSK